MRLPEWLTERGIGESRAVLIEERRIAEARILLDGTVAAGSVIAARLKSAGRNAVAVAEGREYLLPAGAPGVTEGAALSILVTREAIGSEGWKRPLARVTDAAPGDAPPIAGRDLIFPSPEDPLEEAGWSDLIEEARSGIVVFPGGELRVSVTPAMTLIDVDGPGDAEPLALAGAKAAALTIRSHGVGGSIGIDLPTVSGKAGRLAAAEAIDAALPQPFERTAINGFGFTQIVRPRRHASLFELALDRPAFEARALLRRAGRETGAIRLAAHPAIIAAIRPEWSAALSRQIGGAVGLRADPGLAMSGGHAEPA